MGRARIRPASRRGFSLARINRRASLLRRDRGAGPGGLAQQSGVGEDGGRGRAKLTMYKASSTTPNGWLAFELSVLRGLKFRSIALPFGGEPYLGLYLKHWGVRVSANDLAQWSW